MKIKFSKKDEETIEKTVRELYEAKVNAKINEVERSLIEASKKDYMLKIECKDGEVFATTNGNLLSLIVGLMTLKKTLKKKISDDDGFENLCKFIDNYFDIGEVKDGKF